MKHYNGKNRETGVWESFPETIKGLFTHLSDPLESMDEAQDLLGEYADYMEERLEQAEEQYYEENAEAIRQSEKLDIYRREY